MAGLAGERDRVALDAEAADHRRGGLARLLQARALLDVQLEVGGDVGQLGLAHRVEVDVVLLQRVRERDALVVLEVADRVGVERARRRRMSRAGERPKRAPSSSAQSISFSVTAGVSPLCARRTSSAAQHAEAAVEPAAVRHGVDVRADDDDLVAARPGSSPTGSRRRRARRSRRSRRACRAATRAPSRQSSLHASRRAPSGPPVSSASSCRSLSGRSQSKSGMRRDDRLRATPERVRGSWLA